MPEVVTHNGSRLAAHYPKRLNVLADVASLGLAFQHTGWDRTLASRLLKTSRIPSTGPKPVLSLTKERTERSSKRPTEALEAFLPFFRNR